MNSSLNKLYKVLHNFQKFRRRSKSSSKCFSYCQLNYFCFIPGFWWTTNFPFISGSHLRFMKPWLILLYGPFCVELRISIPTPLFSPSIRSSSAEKKKSDESEEDELEEDEEPSVFSLKYVEGSFIRVSKVVFSHMHYSPDSRGMAWAGPDRSMDEWKTIFINPVPIDIKCSLYVYVLSRTNQHSKKCKCSIEFSFQFSSHNEISAKMFICLFLNYKY